VLRESRPVNDRLVERLAATRSGARLAASHRRGALRFASRLNVCFIRIHKGDTGQVQRLAARHFHHRIDWPASRGSRPSVPVEMLPIPYGQSGRLRPGVGGGRKVLWLDSRGLPESAVEDRTVKMESIKKKVGLFLPTELADALDQMASRVGKKQKWLIVGAALVRLMEASEDEQNYLIRQVKIADLPGGSFQGLVAQARSKGGGKEAGFERLVAEEDPAASRPARSPAPGGTSAGTRTPRPAPRPASGRKRG